METLGRSTDDGPFYVVNSDNRLSQFDFTFQLNLGLVPFPNATGNGITIFPGGVPLYKNGQLVGGCGISGDGVDQDDMISFLGLDEAGKILGTINNAPKAMRADTLVPKGTRLRYVQCPQAPYINSNQQNVCSGK